MISPARIARIVGAVCAAAAITFCIAAAGTIPSIVDGSRTLVAIEPLLQQLQLGYTIQGTTLQVDGRRFPGALVERNGFDMAEAHELARFLHLSIVKTNGVLVFSSEQLPDPTDSGPPLKADLDDLRGELLDALNEHRHELGRPPLRVDPIAQQAAQYQADDMARTAQMRHDDASGRTPMQRYAAMGGSAGWYAENVGWYGLDVSGGAALWLAVSKLDSQMMAEEPPDDGHRQNILSSRYGGVGIGVSVGPHGLYLAEDFAGL